VNNLLGTQHHIFSNRIEKFIFLEYWHVQGFSGNIENSLGTVGKNGQSYILIFI